jgi:hypothetical protein
MAKSPQKSPRDQLIAFAALLEKTAADTADLPQLLPAERDHLRQNAGRLKSCIESLADIFDALGAPLQVYDSAGPLCSALSAALNIGSRITVNPIIMRLSKEDQILSAAHARRQREEESKATDKAILALAKPLWKKRPTLRQSTGATASAIAESLNSGRGRPLKKDAIVKRLKKLTNLDI